MRARAMLLLTALCAVSLSAKDRAIPIKAVRAATTVAIVELFRRDGHGT